MRNFGTFIRDVIRKPPVIFPWIALFHVVMLAYVLWIFHTEPLFSVGWLQPLWMLGYTVCWLFVCDMRRWAAYGYMLLTSVNLLLYAFSGDVILRDLYTSALLLIDAGFCVFIMIYFRRIHTPVPAKQKG